MNTRPYTMTTRAQGAEQTTQRILRAATQTFWASPTADIPLDQIAERAGVTTRTILRKFGSKEGLLKASVANEAKRIETQRQAPVGEIAADVAVLMEHYEQMGRQVLGLLTAASGMPALQPLVEQGKQVHRQWCATVFDPYLRDLPDPAQQRRLAQFVALCDVYTWKLLRLDSGLSRPQAELALIEMLTPLTKEPT